MPRTAGVVTIDIELNAKNLETQANQAIARVSKLGAQGQATGRELGQGMDAGASGARRLGSGVDNASNALIHYTSRAHDGISATSRFAKENIAAALAVAKFTYDISKSAESASKSVAWIEKLKRGVVEVRLALATLESIAARNILPLTFFAASTAAGALLAKMVSLTEQRGRAIESQALYSATTNTPFASVDLLDRISKQTSGSDTRGLFAALKSEWTKNHDEVQSALSDLGVHGNIGDPAMLAKIAYGFQTISDPVDRAQSAIKLFGDHAGYALTTLTEGFAQAAEQEQKFGTALTKTDRESIYQFERDIKSLKATLADLFTLDMSWWSSLKTDIEKTTAGTWDLIQAVTSYANKAASKHGFVWDVGPEHAPPSAPAPAGGANAQRIMADDLLAESEGIRDRAKQTLEGQREVLSQAKARSAQLLTQLTADKAKRDQILATLAPGTSGAAAIAKAQHEGVLLKEQDYEYMVLEQRAQTDLAASTNRYIRSAEAANAITEMLAGRFFSLNQELIHSSITAAMVGKTEAAKRDMQAEELVQAERIRVAKRQIAAITPAGQVAPEPTEGQISSAIPQSIAARLKQLAIGKLEIDDIARWREEFDHATRSVTQHVRGQELVTAAIGKTIEEMDKAKVEVELINEFGKDYDNPDRNADIAVVRGLKLQAIQNERAEDITRTQVELKKQIELEHSLAAVQSQGEDAIRRVTLAYKLRDLYASGKKDEIAREIQLADATKATADAKSAQSELDTQTDAIDKLDLEIEAQNLLAAAELKGADAVREQMIANKLAMLDYESASTKVFSTLSTKTRELEESRHKADINKDALATSRYYSDHLANLTQQLSVLNSLATDQSKLAESGVTLRDIDLNRLRIQHEILDTLSQQALATGSLMDGLRAFFTEASAQAEKPGKILHDGLTHATDGVAESLSRAMTGQKAGWGEMLRGVAQGMVKSSVKTLEEKGIEALGKKFPGLHLPVPGAKGPSLAAGDPGHVIVDNLATGNVPGLTPKSLPGTLSPRMPGSIPGSIPIPPAPRYGQMPDIREQTAGGETWTPGSVPFGLPRLPSGLINRTGSPVTSEDTNVGMGYPVPMPPITSTETKLGFDLPRDLTSLGVSSGLPALQTMANGGGRGAMVSSAISGAQPLLTGLLTHLLSKSPAIGADMLGATGAPQLTDFLNLIPMAAGGDVSPSRAYWVGEHGPEPFIPRSHGTIIPNYATGSGGGVVYQIDARGADLGASNRIDRGIEMAHQSAIANAARMQHEQTRRRPQAGRG